MAWSIWNNEMAFKGNWYSRCWLRHLYVRQAVVNRDFVRLSETLSDNYTNFVDNHFFSRITLLFKADLKFNTISSKTRKKTCLLSGHVVSKPMEFLLPRSIKLTLIDLAWSYLLSLYTLQYTQLKPNFKKKQPSNTSNHRILEIQFKQTTRTYSI